MRSDIRDLMQLFYVERVTSFVACAFVLKALLFLALCTEDVERLCFCSIERMPCPLSNIASLKIFDSAFHFSTSRAAHDMTKFHFQFDSAFHSRGKVPRPWNLERLDWLEVLFDLKNELVYPMTSFWTYFFIERLHKASIVHQLQLITHTIYRPMQTQGWRMSAILISPSQANCLL